MRQRVAVSTLVSSSLPGCSDPSWRKICKQNRFCVGMV